MCVNSRARVFSAPSTHGYDDIDKIGAFLCQLIRIAWRLGAVLAGYDDTFGLKVLEALR
jgi:hypothetical protein